MHANVKGRLPWKTENYCSKCEIKVDEIIPRCEPYCAKTQICSAYNNVMHACDHHYILLGYSKFLMVDTAAFFFLTSIVSIYLGGLMPQWWKLIRYLLSNMSPFYYIIMVILKLTNIVLFWQPLQSLWNWLVGSFFLKLKRMLSMDSVLMIPLKWKEYVKMMRSSMNSKMIQSLSHPRRLVFKIIDIILLSHLYLTNILFLDEIWCEMHWNRYGWLFYIQKCRIWSMFNWPTRGCDCYRWQCSWFYCKSVEYNPW